MDNIIHKPETSYVHSELTMMSSDRFVADGGGGGLTPLVQSTHLYMYTILIILTKCSTNIVLTPCFITNQLLAGSPI